MPGVMSEQADRGSFREAASRGVRQAVLHSSGHCWDHVEEMLSPGLSLETQSPSFLLGMGCVSAPCLPCTKILAPRRRAGVGTDNLGTLHCWGHVCVSGRSCVRSSSQKPAQSQSCRRTCRQQPQARPTACFLPALPRVSGGKLQPEPLTGLTALLLGALFPLPLRLLVSVVGHGPSLPRNSCRGNPQTQEVVSDAGKCSVPPARVRASVGCVP